MKLFDCADAFENWPTNDGLNNYLHELYQEFERPFPGEHDWAIKAVYDDLCWRLTEGLELYVWNESRAIEWTKGIDTPIAEVRWVYDSNPHWWGSDPERLDAGFRRLSTGGWLTRRYEPAHLFRVTGIDTLSRQATRYASANDVFALHPGRIADFIDILNKPDPPWLASVLAHGERFIVIQHWGEIGDAPCMGIRCHDDIEAAINTAFARDVAFAERYLRERANTDPGGGSSELFEELRRLPDQRTSP